jgi:hypothetical protein
MLNDSKKISAVCSRFSGGFSGGSVYAGPIYTRQRKRRLVDERARSHGYTSEYHADQEKVMVLRLRPEVLEDRLFPVTLHVIPVIDLTMANRVVDTVSWRLRISKRLVANEKVEVLDPALRGEIARLGWYCRSRSA